MPVWFQWFIDGVVWWLDRAERFFDWIGGAK